MNSLVHYNQAQNKKTKTPQKGRKKKMESQGFQYSNLAKLDEITMKKEIEALKDDEFDRGFLLGAFISSGCWLLVIILYVVMIK